MNNTIFYHPITPGDLPASCHKSDDFHRYIGMALAELYGRGIYPDPNVLVDIIQTAISTSGSNVNTEKLAVQLYLQEYTQ
mgnify:CR=1 FL=1